MKKVIIFVFVISISFLWCFASVTHQDQFTFDMEKVINHILNDKVTFEHTTYRQMLDDLNLEADNIYNLYLSDKSNPSKNKIYYERLNEINGIIDMYPESMCEDMKDVIDKYNMEIIPNPECDFQVYEKYIENNKINNAFEFKKLIDYRESSFQKIINYQAKILKKI